MDKDRGNKFGFFKSFSFRIVIIALLIICAAFLSIIVPLTIYIDIFAIFLLCLIAIIMCIKELKDKKFKEFYKENEYWLKDDLDNTGANYRIAYSQRGPGKSYQIKCQAIDNWLDGGKQFGLIRRLDKNLSIDKVSEYWDDMTEYFYEKASLVFPAYDQFFISPKSGKWTVYGLVTASGRKDKLGVIGYYFSCSCADNYKSSGSYPDIVFDVYEEFMSNTHQYLPNEFDALMSIISTTKRRS